MNPLATFQSIASKCGATSLACNLTAVAEHHLEPIGDRRAASPRRDSSSGRVAHMRLQGILTQHGGFYYGTSTDAFGKAFDAAVEDASVRAIVIEVDSPGGDCRGTPELAERIYRARHKKEIAAIANSDAHSAALWIASAADQLHVTPSGSVGSIGVWCSHIDLSAALEREGVNVTLLYSGEYKTEGNPYEPLSDAARKFTQGEIDTIHGQFIRAVAKHRNVTAAKVAKDFGRGRSFNSATAKAVGMVDGVQEFDGLARSLTATPVERRRAALATRERLNALERNL